MEPLPDLGSLSDDELKELIERARARGAARSATERRILHGKIDILRAELVARLQKSGGRSVLDQVDVDTPHRRSCTGKACAVRDGSRRLSHVYCPECGFQNPEAANYCSRCGALLVKREPAAETTQTFSPEEVERATRHERARGPRGPGARRPLRRRPRGGELPADAASARAIGRSPDCEIFLDDVTVSRKHAVLVEQNGDDFRIEDQGSAERHLRQPQADRPRRARERRRAPDRQVPADLPRAMTATADRRPGHARAPAHDRRGRARACATSSRTSRSRRSATSRTRACSRRGARSGGYRLFSEDDVERLADDPAAAARRVPAAARDPRGARRAGREGAQAPRPAGSASAEESSTSTSSASAPGIDARPRAGARGVRPARPATERAATSATPRPTPTSPPSARSSRATASRRATCATFRTAADREAALLEQLVAPALRARNAERRAAGARATSQSLAELAQELSPAPLLARPARVRRR